MQPQGAIPKSVLIVTDAWRPQINGVVRTLERLGEELTGRGVIVDMLTPCDFKTIPMPTYPDIRLALTTPSPDFAAHPRNPARPCPHRHRRPPRHIGAASLSGARNRLHHQLSHALSGISQRPPADPGSLELWLAAQISQFERRNAGRDCLARSRADRRAASIRSGRGTVGSTQNCIRPDRAKVLDLPRPIFLNVGRVAVEKNLPAFLDLDLPGSKVVVGDGPQLAALRERYPHVTFLGAMTGEALADIYASADIFVFPSRTDTFGIVLLEALASGLPVAAYPVTGPLDVLGDGVGGRLSEDLRAAALGALDISPAEARAKALQFSWAKCAELFLKQAAAAQSTHPLKAKDTFLSTTTPRLGSLNPRPGTLR